MLLLKNCIWICLLAATSLPLVEFMCDHYKLAKQLCIAEAAIGFFCFIVDLVYSDIWVQATDGYIEIVLIGAAVILDKLSKQPPKN